MTFIFRNNTIFWNISKWNKGFLIFDILLVCLFVCFFCFFFFFFLFFVFLGESDILLVHLITILTFLEVSSREVYKKQNKNYQFYGIDSMVSSLKKKKKMV